MDGPSKEDKPQHGGKDKLDECLQKPTLQELAKARHEEAAQSGEHVSRGAWA
jgi:hypothetical protein